MALRQARISKAPSTFSHVRGYRALRLLILTTGFAGGLLASTAGRAVAAAPVELPDLLSTQAPAAMTPLSALGLERPATTTPELQLASHQSSGSAGKGSGLGWKSGAACHSAGFDSWRGRTSDAHNKFSGKDNFRSVVKLMQGSWLRQFSNKPGVFSLGLALLTNDTRGKFGDCNAGKFDGYFKDIGKALKSHGLGDAIIRLGWEANGSGFPWFAGKQPDAYKECFRRQVKNLKSQAPGLKIEWTMRKDSALGYSVEKIYPGNDVVDIVGLLYYDRWPNVHSDKEWQAAANEKKNGGPKGINTYLQFAKSKGKKLAVPEWAISDGHNDRSSKDNPFFIEKMFQFFKSNAGSIAYETYFNCEPASAYKLYPSHYNPKAAAKYQQLW